MRPAARRRRLLRARRARDRRGAACAFPACGDGEVADVDAGCVDLAGVSRGGPKACSAGTLVVEGRRFACVPADAACPQGSRAAPARAPGGTLDGTDGGASICEHRPSCPPGSLEAGGACRPVVLRSARGPVVDVGAWATLVLGADGGPGSPDLCRPLQTHPFEVGLAPGESLELALRIGLRVPDQDVAAVHARVALQVAAPTSRPIAPGATALAERAVAALVEPLRGLGGQASASSVELELRCNVASL